MFNNHLPSFLDSQFSIGWVCQRQALLSSLHVKAHLGKCESVNTFKWGQENFLLGKMFFHFFLKDSTEESWETAGASVQWICLLINGGGKPPALEPTNCVSPNEQLAAGALGDAQAFCYNKSPKTWRTNRSLGESEQGLLFWDLLTAWFYCRWAAYSENWSYGGIFSMVQLKSTFTLVTKTK